MYKKIYDKLENEGYSLEDAKIILGEFIEQIRAYGMLNNEQVEDVLETVKNFKGELNESDNVTNTLYKTRDYFVNAYKSTAIGDIEESDDIAVRIMESNRNKDILNIYDYILAK